MVVCTIQKNTEEYRTNIHIYAYADLHIDRKADGPPEKRGGEPAKQACISPSLCQREGESALAERGRESASTCARERERKRHSERESERRHT